jgi:hypothetical protein
MFQKPILHLLRNMMMTVTLWLVLLGDDCIVVFVVGTSVVVGHQYADMMIGRASPLF